MRSLYCTILIVILSASLSFSQNLVKINEERILNYISAGYETGSGVNNAIPPSQSHLFNRLFLQFHIDNNIGIVDYKTGFQVFRPNKNTFHLNGKIQPETGIYDALKFDPDKKFSPQIYYFNEIEFDIPSLIVYLKKITPKFDKSWKFAADLDLYAKSYIGIFPKFHILDFYFSPEENIQAIYNQKSHKYSMEYGAHVGFGAYRDFEKLTFFIYLNVSLGYYHVIDRSTNQIYYIEEGKLTIENIPNTSMVGDVGLNFIIDFKLPPKPNKLRYKIKIPTFDIENCPEI